MIKNERLRNLYLNEVKKVWGKDNDMMISFCMNGASNLIELSVGLLPIKKMSIRSRFWIGYSDIGQGMSYREANEMIDECQRNKHDYFISQNLRMFDGKYPTDRYVYVHREYEESELLLYVAKSDFFNGETKLSDSDMEKYRNVIEIERAAFIKRLETYYKKYSDKILIDSYWIDR